MVERDTVWFEAEAKDANGHAVAGAEFTWASGDTAVAVVDATGLVTGVGEVEITATTAGVTGRAVLVVAAPAPTTLAITPDTVEVVVRDCWRHRLAHRYPAERLVRLRYGGRLVFPRTPDIMSYCQPVWISDYHFTNALRYRLFDDPPPAAAIAASSKSLLLWGGISADSVPFLEPAFVVDAPAALPDSAGEYRVTGRTTSGDELFSLTFTMPETADGDGRSSFAFVLPVRPGWEANLSSITLSGPGGRVRSRAGPGGPFQPRPGPSEPPRHARHRTPEAGATSSPHVIVRSI